MNYIAVDNGHNHVNTNHLEKGKLYVIVESKEFDNVIIFKDSSGVVMRLDTVMPFFSERSGYIYAKEINTIGIEYGIL